MYFMVGPEGQCSGSQRGLWEQVPRATGSSVHQVCSAKSPKVIEQRDKVQGRRASSETQIGPQASKPPNGRSSVGV